MSHREFVEWQAWYTLTPRGEDRDEHLAAWIAYVIARVAAGAKGASLRYRDFMPLRPRPAAADMSDDALLDALDRAAPAIADADDVTGGQDLGNHR